MPLPWQLHGAARYAVRSADMCMLACVRHVIRQHAVHNMSCRQASTTHVQTFRYFLPTDLSASCHGLWWSLPSFLQFNKYWQLYSNHRLANGTGDRGFKLILSNHQEAPIWTSMKVRGATHCGCAGHQSRCSA